MLTLTHASLATVDELFGYKHAGLPLEPFPGYTPDQWGIEAHNRPWIAATGDFRKGQRHRGGRRLQPAAEVPRREIRRRALNRRRVRPVRGRRVLVALGQPARAAGELSVGEVRVPAVRQVQDLFRQSGVRIAAPIPNPARLLDRRTLVSADVVYRFYPPNDAPKPYAPSASLLLVIDDA
jgi:hypothetical protein